MKGSRQRFIIIILCSIVFVVVISIIILTSGTTITSGNHPDPEESISLSCSNNNYDYDFFTYDNADGKEIRINTIFSNNKITSIGLIYKMYYSSIDLITASEANNHARMNTSFANSALSPDALGANYVKSSDSMQFSLYTSGDNLNSNTAKYFLISDYDSREVSIEELEKIYKSEGLNCTNSKE